MVQGSAQVRMNAALRTRTTMNAKTLNLKVGDLFDFYRTPDRKEDSGWFGPAEVVDVSQSSRDSVLLRFATREYRVSSSCIRRHLVFFVGLASSQAQLTPSKAWHEYKRLVDTPVINVVHHVGSAYDRQGYQRTKYDKRNPSLFPRLRTWASDQLGLNNVAAVRYGKAIKRYNQIRGFCQSVIIAWDHDDPVFRIIDVQSHTDQATNQMQVHKVHVDPILPQTWPTTSSIQFLLIPEMISHRGRKEEDEHVPKEDISQDTKHEEPDSLVGQPLSDIPEEPSDCGDSSPPESLTMWLQHEHPDLHRSLESEKGDWDQHLECASSEPLGQAAAAPGASEGKARVLRCATVRYDI